MRVNLKSEEFKATYDQTCTVFAKYQMAVHKDHPGECDEMQVRLSFVTGKFNCTFKLPKSEWIKKL